MSGDRKNHNMLAIDTAQNTCGVVVYNADRDAYTQDILDMRHRQATHLIPLCNRLMEKAGLSYNDLHGVIVTIGPGAFTGLRVGLSAGYGFQVGLQIPLWGITTFQALAAQFVMQVCPDDVFSVLIDTRRDDFYVQNFRADGTPAGPPRLRHVSNLAPDRIYVGDGAIRLAAEHQVELMHPTCIVIDPSIMIKTYQAGEAVLTENPSPLYLRAADVSVSKKPQRVLEE